MSVEVHIKRGFKQNEVETLPLNSVVVLVAFTLWVLKI